MATKKQKAEEAAAKAAEEKKQAEEAAAKAEAEAKEAEEAQAAADKAAAEAAAEEVDASAAYTVATGKAITSLRGMLNPGAEVKAEYLSGGKEALKALVKSGAVVKTK